MTELNRTEAKLTTADMAARTAGPAPVPAIKKEAVRDDLVAENLDRRTEVRNATTDRRDWDNVPTITADQQVRDGSVVTPLFSDSDVGDLRSRWSNVQAEFVDEPRRAVEEADQLVATVMQRLAEGFARERGSLEKQWESGENASTEDLRMALQRYRAFFNRLLNAALRRKTGSSQQKRCGETGLPIQAALSFVPMQLEDCPDQEKNKACEPYHDSNDMKLDPTITKPLPVCR